VTSSIQEGVADGIIRTDIPPFEIAILLWTTMTGVLRLIENKERKTIWEDKPDAFSMNKLDVSQLLVHSIELLLRSIRID